MRLAKGFGIMVLALVCAVAVAADNPKKIKYSPPTGVFGHKWGALRSTFSRLPQQPLGVYAAWMRPVVTASGVDCSGATCDAESTFMTIWTKREGGGFHVLSEYAIDQQGM